MELQSCLGYYSWTKEARISAVEWVGRGRLNLDADNELK